MQLRALRYLHEAASCGSIRLAAKRLHVAPSALSRQITILEHEFNAALFERLPRGVRLTPAGEVLYSYTRQMFGELKNVRAHIDDLNGLRRGEVTIKTVEGVVPGFICDLLALFHCEYPLIEFHVTIGGSDGIVAALLSDEADIAVIYDAPERSDIETVARHRVPGMAVVAPDHPLARKKRLSLAELFAHPLALPDHSFGLRSLIEKEAKDNGYALNPVVTTNAMELIKGMARQGTSVAILTDILVERELARGELVTVPIDNERLATAEIQVCVRRDRALSVSVEEFLSFACRQMKDRWPDTVLQNDDR